ncbi:MAG: TetR/AcrR family transcriptional regulator [Streptococcus sp.]|nr:TetR/AcrR family transcriptional regulator [Streptococcus sp.]
MTKENLINQSILASAKKEFLAYGYEKASLRQICKQANVTTGALYKRYKGKEELFGTLVRSTLQDLTKWIEEHVRQDYVLLQKGQTPPMTSNRYLDHLHHMMDFIYNHEDEMCLLLFKSTGSRYDRFTEETMISVTDETYRYLQAAKELHLITQIVDKEHLHLALHSYFGMIFAPLSHGWNKEQAFKFCETIVALFNWGVLLGFEEETISYRKDNKNE